MSQDSMLHEIRCELSRSFPVAENQLKLGRYKLHALPTKRNGRPEALLVFEAHATAEHTNPEKEGEIILSFLSLLFNCKTKKTGYRANGVDSEMLGMFNAQPSQFFEGKIELKDYSGDIQKLMSLGKQLTHQFVRACNAYSLALSSVEIDQSLAFLLLVTALECISTQEEFCPNKELNKSAKSTERYCRLVGQYCLKKEELYPNGGEQNFIRDLKTVYYSHRSAFVHAGKEVSIASKVADRLNIPSLGHFVDGQEIFTPGLKWFFEVTRRTLLGFLVEYTAPNHAMDENVFAKIAVDNSALILQTASS